MLKLYCLFVRSIVYSYYGELEIFTYIILTIYLKRSYRRLKYYILNVFKIRGINFEIGFRIFKWNFWIYWESTWREQTGSLYIIIRISEPWYSYVDPFSVRLLYTQNYSIHALRNRFIFIYSILEKCGK